MGRILLVVDVVHGQMVRVVINTCPKRRPCGSFLGQLAPTGFFAFTKFLSDMDIVAIKPDRVVELLTSLKGFCDSKDLSGDIRTFLTMPCLYQRFPAFASDHIRPGANSAVWIAAGVSINRYHNNYLAFCIMELLSRAERGRVTVVATSFSLDNPE